MGDFWATQRAVATKDLIDTVGNLAASMRQQRANEAAEKKFRAGYAVALEQAKKTGVLPEIYQAKVGFDMVGEQVGIKVVALRELSKTAPNHPLVKSQKVRENIGLQTLMNFNKANRPSNADINDYAPSDVAAQKIYAITLGIK